MELSHGLLHLSHINSFIVELIDCKLFIYIIFVIFDDIRYSIEEGAFKVRNNLNDAVLRYFFLSTLTILPDA